MDYLYILQQALLGIITIFWLYNIAISVCSLIKFKEKPLLINKTHKFMAIIPAHNEEKVVRNLIESLKEQNYPKEYLDIYVIADNCTDNTAKISKEAGAIVYERNDPEKKTKGYAMQWFLAKMKEKNVDYDALCVFDADNIVDKEFMNAMNKKLCQGEEVVQGYRDIMNKKLCQGEEVVQGYRDIKNPDDTWITAGYALFYWTMHRFYHLARYNVGLSPLLNGTGFMVKYDLIKEEGWNTKTLTEDIEFSLINIAKGRALGWATDAKVYDEQPLGFKQSWTQRTRWSVGHIQCFKYYVKDLAAGVVRNRKIMNFDGLLYLMGMPILIVTLAILVINLIIYIGDGMTLAGLIWNYAKYMVATFIIPPLTAILTLLLDKRPIKPMIKGLLCYPLFLGSWLVINFKCLFKRDTSWEKINHIKDVKINEIA